VARGRKAQPAGRARQYFHFALIILLSFPFASLSSSLFFHLLPAHVSHPSPARVYPDSRSSSSQSELAARQMKIYRSPCPVGGFNLICHSVVAETAKGRDSSWTLLLVKRAASMRFYIPSRRRYAVSKSPQACRYLRRVIIKN